MLNLIVLPLTKHGKALHCVSKILPVMLTARASATFDSPTALRRAL